MKLQSVDYKVDVISKSRSIGPDARIRIIYAVEGRCTLTRNEKEIKLGKTDVISVNARTGCLVETEEDALAVVLSLDYYELCGLFGMSSVRLLVDSTVEESGMYRALKEQMQRFLLSYVNRGQTGRIMEQGNLYLLLELLADHFIGMEGLPVTEDSDSASQIVKIIRYIHENYRASVSLNAIAEELFISPSWVSRVFQKETGERFADYVKKLRLDHAKEELENTDHAVTQIALDNGFSTPSAFNRAFKAEYNVTPTEYREICRKNHSEEGKAEDDHRERLIRILDEDRKLTIAEQENQRTLSVDVSQLLPWKKWENRILNVGAVDQLSSASLQRHVLFLADKLEIEYVRMWNLFSPKMMILGEKKGEYNFAFLDEILDFCVDNRLKVFLDLAQRKDVAMASERQPIYSREEISEFEDEADWLDALRNFLVHIRRRYHSKVVGGWIFELSFFLNDRPYYISPRYRAVTVWDRSCELIRAVIPSAKIAGPGMLAGLDLPLIKNIIRDYFASDHLPDIFTSIHFPYAPEWTAGSRSIYQADYRKTFRKDFLEKEVLAIREELARYGFKGELWVTDWGNSLANRNYLQDSCFRAAFIVENVLRCHEQTGAMGIFYASDLINLYSDSREVLTGSAGLLSRNGISKPAYYAFRFLNRLGKYRILQTDQCIVTAEHTGDIRILCFNSKALGPRYYLREENSYLPDELDQLFVDLDSSCLELNIHFPEEEELLAVRQEILNTEKGSVLDKWNRFDCSDNLTRSDLEYLERTSIPEIIAERVVPIDRSIHISVKMEANEIRLILITRE